MREIDVSYNGKLYIFLPYSLTVNVDELNLIISDLISAIRLSALSELVEYRDDELGILFGSAFTNCLTQISELPDKGDYETRQVLSSALLYGLGCMKITRKLISIPITEGEQTQHQDVFEACVELFNPRGNSYINFLPQKSLHGLVVQKDGGGVYSLEYFQPEIIDLKMHFKSEAWHSAEGLKEFIEQVGLSKYYNFHLITNYQYGIYTYRCMPHNLGCLFAMSFRQNMILLVSHCLYSFSSKEMAY